MSEQLGSLLVRARRLRPLQLEEALRRQRERGGRLGTNLVELGFVDLELLTAALSGQRRIVAATAAEFESASPSALGLLSRDLAARCLAYPLRAGQGALVVAMASPWDADAVRALEAAVGRSIVAKLAPELRILEYLEQRYALPHPRKARAPAAASPSPAAPEPEGPFGRLGAGEYLSSEEDDPYLNAGGSFANAPPLGAPPPSTPPAAASPARQPTQLPAPAPRMTTQPPMLAPQATMAAPRPTPHLPAAPVPAPVVTPALPTLPLPTGVSLDPFGDLLPGTPVPPADLFASAPAVATPAVEPSGAPPSTLPELAPLPPLDLAPEPLPMLEVAPEADLASVPLLELEPEPEPELLEGALLAEEAEPPLLEAVPEPEPAAPTPLDIPVPAGADPLAALAWDMPLDAATAPLTNAAAEAPAPAAAPAASPVAPPPPPEVEAEEEEFVLSADELVEASEEPPPAPADDLLDDPAPAAPPVPEPVVVPAPALDASDWTAAPPPAAVTPPPQAPIAMAEPSAAPTLDRSNLATAEPAAASEPGPEASLAAPLDRVPVPDSAFPPAPPSEPGESAAPADLAGAADVRADPGLAPEPVYRPVPSLFMVEDALARATRPEKIAETLLWACEGRFEAAAFLTIEGGVARGLEGFGTEGSIRFRNDLSVELAQPSLLSAAVEKQTHLLAALEPADAAICARLGIPPGGLGVVVPFVYHGIVVTALWAALGRVPEREQLAEEVERLAAIGAKAFARTPWGVGR